MSHIKSLICAVLMSIVTPLAAVAGEAFPSKPVRIVVPFAAGGLYDIVARLLGSTVNQMNGWTVVVENRPGAGGTLGANVVAKATADGYTLLMAGGGPITIGPALYASLPYDAARDLIPVTYIAETPMILMASTDYPAKTVAEVLARAKTKPNAVSYASFGNGSVSHLMMELFEQSAGTKMLHVPYTGAAPALQDVALGRSDLTWSSLGSAKAFMDGKRIRAIAVGNSRRSPALPNVPTVTEAGVPGVEVPVWLGVMAPAGVPSGVVERMNTVFLAALRSPETNKRLIASGVDLVLEGPGPFSAVIKEDLARWARVIKQGNIKVQ